MQQTYRRAAVVVALIVSAGAGYLIADAQHAGAQDRVPVTVPINAYDTTPVSSPAPPRNA